MTLIEKVPVDLRDLQKAQTLTSLSGFVPFTDLPVPFTVDYSFASILFHVLYLL